MRSMLRNKQKLTYSLYKGMTEVVDKYGDPTGDYDVSYGEETPFFANISSNRGRATYGNFGIDDNAEYVISTTDMNCPIDVDTIIRINGKPFVVVRRSQSLSNILFSVKGV